MHYTVKDVQNISDEKVLLLEGTYTRQQIVVHLKGGWCDTPVEPGHCVNLIAEKFTGSDGLLHAVCDFDAGACNHLLAYESLKVLTTCCSAHVVWSCALMAAYVLT